jgi:hypothetical protein
MAHRPRFMNRTELAAWRLQNPDYLYPGTLRPDWVPPQEWGEPVWRKPLVYGEDTPPRSEFLLFHIPPGITPRRDFNMPFPGQVLVRRALPRPIPTTTIDIEEEDHDHR